MINFIHNEGNLIPSPCAGKDLAHFEPFLGFADLTLQDPELPIRFEACDFSCDIGQCNILLYAGA